MKDKLGIALVGLGKYSEGQLAPALKETAHCYLAGIVTGDAEKGAKWREEHGIPEGNVYNYENFDSIRDNEDIDIVYIVLPNALHKEYVIRAARAGKHVICEKPMAVSVEECAEMIRACEEAGVKLSIGYRLHFEPYNRAMAELHRNGKIGRIKKIVARHGMELEDHEWRATRALAGGGPLMDVGIYCVQAAIYTAGREPVAVTAEEGRKTKPFMFQDVEQSLRFTLDFGDGLVAQCESSYAEKYDLLRVEGDAGWMQLDPAYAYEGLKAAASSDNPSYPEVNQQARQMDDFALCVREGRDTPVPGAMGLRDVMILMAIYEAMQTGQRVELKGLPQGLG